LSAPWIAAVVCLWVVVVVLAVVVAGVLRRVATVLESLPAAGQAGRVMPAGPPVGDRLPGLEVVREDGSVMSLSELPGPLVLAVLTSHCSPCLAVADRLRDPELAARLDGLVVLTDGEGRGRLALGDPVVVLADSRGELMSVLQLPGTPFVVGVDCDGVIGSAQILGGPEQLVDLLAEVRGGAGGSATRSMPA